LLGDFQKNSCISGAIPRDAAEERQDFVELGAFELNRAFFSWEAMGTFLNLLLIREKL
jgi:hypothetical protein